MFFVLMNCVVIYSGVFRDVFPMILCANKVDLVHARKVTEEQGKELAAKLRVRKSQC